jgi:transcriptional/translational regulatory protein YebC/TACO1
MYVPRRIHPLRCGVLTRERECLTDNGNRTLHQVREILNDHK